MDTEMSATLDLGPLHLAIGDLTNSIQDLRRHFTKWEVDQPASAAAICPTPTATFALDLGSPPDGRWWEVKSLVIGGNDITVTPTGKGWVVVMAGAPSANPPLFAVKDWTSTLPSPAFYGSHQLIVESQERLWVVITGGTAGVQYVANAMVQSFPQFVRGKP